MAHKRIPVFRKDQRLVTQADLDRDSIEREHQDVERFAKGESFAFDAQVVIENGTLSIYSHKTGALLVEVVNLPSDMKDPAKEPLKLRGYPQAGKDPLADVPEEFLEPDQKHEREMERQADRAASFQRPVHCLHPEICGPRNGYQCENWLRNHEGCEAVHAGKRPENAASRKKRIRI